MMVGGRTAPPSASAGPASGTVPRTAGIMDTHASDTTRTTDGATRTGGADGAGGTSRSATARTAPQDSPARPGARLRRAASALSGRFQPVPSPDQAVPQPGGAQEPIATIRAIAQRRAGRIVSVLRLVVVVGILVDLVFFPPREHVAASIAIAAVYTAWSLVLLTGAWRDALPAWGVWTVLLVDLPALTALLAVSGSLSDPTWATPFTDDAFVLIPILAAFQLRPRITAACGAASTLVYAAATTAGHSHATPDPHYVALHAVFIALVSVAAVLLSWVQQSRTAMIAALAQHRADLLAQTMSADDRERRDLAEALHDGALQNVLVARQDLDEAQAQSPSEELRRAEQALREVTGQLRSCLSELHPAVLEHRGLGQALEQLARQVGARAHVRVEVDCRAPDAGYETDRLLYHCARELLGNAAKHARASLVQVRLYASADEIRLEVADDGVGLPADGVRQRVAEGHIGLASQRVRIESSGGTLVLSPNRPGGTLAVVTLPRRAAPASPPATHAPTDADTAG